MNQNIDQLLKSRKLRITPVRVQVYEFFVSQNHAHSHADLENHFPELDRITLYRTLKSFEEAGLLHAFVDDKGSQRFALCESKCGHQHHHDEHLHFHCIKCRQYYCLPQVQVSIPPMPAGFELGQIKLSAEGICASCGQLAS